MTRKLFASRILLTLACAILFSACSKTPESSTNVAATPTPEAKMEGQSANWKLTVVSVDQVPKQDPFMPGDPEGPEHRSDTLQLTVEATYTGSAAGVQSPSAHVIDNSGRNLQAEKASLLRPGAIYSISSGAGVSSLQTIFTGEEGAPSVDELGSAQTEKEVKELLQWLDPQSLKTARALKGGEKFQVLYYFQDPKDYTNLKFAFSDVPPIGLQAPKTAANPSS